MKPVAVVTGASSGIGQATAIAFANAGYELFIHGFKNQKGLQETKIAIEQIYKQINPELQCEMLAGDLSNDQGIFSLFDAASKWKSRIDVCFNGAGADVLTGSASELSFAQKLDLLWSVDVRSTMLLSRQIATFMQQQSAGELLPTIINLSWDQADRGMEGDSGQFFGATKAAISAFSKSLAISIGPRVRVNCIAPGWIRTAWGKTSSITWQERAVGETALQRWGTPEDIAQTAVWLCSPVAQFINGQVIAVNGGWKPAYKPS